MRFPLFAASIAAWSRASMRGSDKVEPSQLARSGLVGQRRLAAVLMPCTTVVLGADPQARYERVDQVLAVVEWAGGRGRGLRVGRGE